MRMIVFVPFLIFLFVSCETNKEQIQGQLNQTDLNPQEREAFIRGDMTSIVNPNYLSGPAQVDCRTPEEIEAERIALQRPRNLTPIDRPRDGESAESTYRKCLNWARTSAQKSPPVRTLTVGYEGLMSYSSSYANKMYKYYDDLAAGINAAMPGKATMSYVASNIIRPNLRESVNKSDFLLLPHTDTTMKPYVAESCIKAWKEVHGSQFKLNIVGHSFGGNSSRKLMQSLNENHPNVTNIEMILVDARSSNPLNYVTNFTTENNVSRNSVFYQKGLVMPGYPFSGPNTSNTRLRGSDLPFINSRCGGLNSHARTTCSPQVHSAFQRMMAR